MKTILLIAILFIQTLMYSQTYSVIKVRGEILSLNSNKIIKQGDTLNLNDKLKFVSTNSYALVMNSKRERFYLKLPDREEATVDEFTAFAKNSLIIVDNIYGNTRGIDSYAKRVSNLAKYFGKDKFTIIGNKLSLSLNNQVYRLSDGQKIIAKIRYRNKDFHSELNSESNCIALSTYKFQVPYNYQVNTGLYLKNKKKEDISITEFELKFIEILELESELKTIVKKFNSVVISKMEMKDILKKYFFDFYGKTDNFLLNKFLNDVIKENMD